MLAGYERLSARLGREPEVAVRSSATAEDLPEASFAGAAETFLNVHGREALLRAVHACFASLFTDRAISYRARLGFDQLQVALSVGVMPMVRSDKASSGVIFTLDPESGFRDAVVVTGPYGLGEFVVQGVVTPDEWMVFKPTLAARLPRHRRPPARHEGSSARLRATAAAARAASRRRRPSARQFSLSDDDVLTLARWACLIEDALLGARRPAAAHGHRVGQGRHHAASSSSSRRGRKPSIRRKAVRATAEIYRLDGAARHAARDRAGGRRERSRRAVRASSTTCRRWRR